MFAQILLPTHRTRSPVLLAEQRLNCPVSPHLSVYCPPAWTSVSRLKSQESRSQASLPVQQPPSARH
ncbi:hypothetical protein BDW71DRAFT_183748 [Aspergillus fruticulosus]